MKKTTYKEILNVLFVIVFAYIYIHFAAPYINLIFSGRFASWGIALIVIGIWGNTVKMTLLKSLFLSKDYKKENYFFIITGAVLLLIGVFQMISALSST